MTEPLEPILGRTDGDAQAIIDVAQMAIDPATLETDEPIVVMIWIVSVSAFA